MRHVLAPCLRLAMACLAGSSVAACQETAPPPPESGRQGGAQGTVLEGTISDAMLPLDVVIQPDAPPAIAIEGDAASPDAEAESGAGNGGAPATDAAPADPPPADDTAGEEAAPDQSSDG